VTGFDREIRI